MDTKEAVIRKLREIKPELVSKYPISELALFGSCSGEDSHIDILVDFDGKIGMKFFTLVYELENIFNKKVDLVPRKGIKPNYLQQIEKSLIHV